MPPKRSRGRERRGGILMGKWVHRLKNIDLENRTADCDNCGPVNVVIKNRSGKTYKHVTCKVKYLEQRRKYRKRNPRGTRPGGDGWKYRSHVKDTCENCGFVAKDLCQMDVDHIDGNHSNNDPSNLQTLCANCHRLKTKLERNGMYAFHRKPE